MNRPIIKYIFFLGLFLLLYSCVPIKKIYYLRKNKKDTITVNKTPPLPPVYRLHKGDLVYIKILAFDERNAQLFNTISSNFTYNGTEQLSVNLNSYMVNDSGYIVMPLFEKIYVDSLTLDQAQEKIRTKVKSYITGADVFIKLLSFRVTFLGEFNKPGCYTIYNNKISIFEAIGLAGDMTSFGDKNKLMIIRQSENNKIYYVDLTDRSLIYSDFYYLKPDDILYAEPLKVKRRVIQNPTISAISVLLASLVDVVLLINYFK